MKQSRMQQSSRLQQPSVSPVNHLETEMSSVRAGQTMSVQVVHVESYLSFFCQLRKQIVARDEMMDKLDAYCRALSKDEGKANYIEPGMYFVAKFSEDEGWYRARVIQQTTREGYLVHYVDYGNSEVVNIRDMKNLPPQFSHLPSQAIECSLSGVKPQTSTSDATRKLMSLTDGKGFKAKVIRVSGMKLEIDLIDETSGKSINQEMGNMRGQDLAQLQVSSQKYSMPTVSKKLTYAMRTLSFKKPVSVYPSHIESLVKFYLQFASEEDQLTNLATELNDKYSTLSASQLRLKNTAIGDVCVAQFSEDGSWYRATITELNGMRATVRFLDYGNTDKSSTIELKEVMEKYLSTPAFAVECTLNVVEDTSSEQTAKFEELMMAEGAEVTAEFLYSRMEPVAVKVTVNGQNIATSLGLTLDRKHPSYKTPVVSSRVKVKVTPTSVESPSLLYLQVSATEEESQTFVDTVNEYYTNIGKDELVLSNADVGMPCVAQFSEDQAWYRATITDLTQNQATVTFVDFGNSDVVSVDCIKTVTSEFMDRAPYALQCKLRNVSKPAAGWPDELCADLEATLMEEDILIAAEFHSNTFPAEIDVFVNTKNLVDTLKLKNYQAEGEVTELAERESFPTYPTPSIPAGEVTASLSSIYSPTDFYIRLRDAETELAAYSAKLQDDYSQLDSLKWEQDQVKALQAGIDTTKEEQKANAVSHEETEEPAFAENVVKEDVEMEEEKEEIEIEKESPDYDSAYEGEEQLDAQADVTIEEVVEIHETAGNEETSDQNDGKDENECPHEEIPQELDTVEQDAMEEKLAEEYEIKESTKDPGDPGKEASILTKNEKLEAGEEDDGQDSEKVDETSQENTDETETVEKESQKFKSTEEASDETKEGDSLDNEEEDKGETKDAVENEKHEETTDGIFEEGFEHDEQSQEDHSEQVEEDVELEEEHSVSKEIQETTEIEVKLDMDTKEDVETQNDPETETSKELEELEDLTSGEEDVEAEINLNMGVTDVTIGMPCVVRYTEDSTWYRAKVTAVEGTEANVIFIDYGRSATVDVTSLKRVTQEHLRRAPFAYHCQLDRITEPAHGWTQDSNDEFISSVEAADVSVSFLTMSESFKVRISVDGEDILGKLPGDWQKVVEPATYDVLLSNAEVNEEDDEFKNAAESREKVEEGMKAQQDYNYPAQNLNKGHIFHAYASDVKSPSQFYLQLVSQENYLTDLAEEVNELYSINQDAVQPLRDARVNRPCVAQFTDEEGNSAWYRAKIAEIEDNIATVLFVDYGNSESVHVHEIKEITDKYLGIMPYAIYCQLNTPIVEDEVERFAEVILEAEELKAEVVDDGEPVTVKLSVDGKDILSLLSEGLETERKPDEYIDNTYGQEQIDVGDEEAAQYATPDTPDQDESEDNGMYVIIIYICTCCKFELIREEKVTQR